MAGNVQYKCKKCGGPLEFDAGKQKLACPFCDSVFDISEYEDHDEQLQQEPQSSQGSSVNVTDDEISGEWNVDAGGSWDAGEQENWQVWRCPSCGGEIIGDANTAASLCPYCSNPTVMAGQLKGVLKPDLIIPFRKTKEDAVAAFEKNLEGKKLLPKIFKDRHHIDEIKGIYIPFWLFDAQVYADIDYHATKVRVWSDPRNTYTETSTFLVSRQGSLSFENLPCDGSKKMPNDLMESIEPFSYEEAKPFSGAYLAGYLADKYDVTAKDSLGTISARAKNSTKAAFASTVKGYNTVTAGQTQISVKNTKAKYALLPVWLLNTNWNGKTYSFAMNGQTGKFVGDLPIDEGQSRKYFWSITGIVTAIGAVIGLISFFL